MRRVVVAALLALLAAPVAAQQAQDGLRIIPVDRVVAIVAKKPILWSEVLERISIARAQGLQVPRDSAGQIAVAREILNQLVDEEVLIAVADDYKLEVPEADVSARVDQQIDQIRGQFQTETEFREALRREGFGTPEEYRRRTIEQAQRDERQRKAIDTLRALGRMAPVNVSEREVAEAFDRLKARLGPRPAMVAFRQVVVTPRARAENREKARARIDSLRALLEAGADFDSLARATSMDPGSAVQGGDLGWNRRGRMVQAFDQMMFALAPGRISPVVETEYGFHVIRVDRVRAGEVRARHILIKPDVDEVDATAARARADSALALWRGGMPFDTVIAKYHDIAEERSIPDGVPVDSLPPEYRVALRTVPEGQFAEVFAIPDPAGLRKYIVAYVTSAKPAGEWDLADYQERIRRQMQEERSTRRTLDTLRREYYVALRL